MTTPIKTRRDGSIDTAHYMALGRMARSEAAHDLLRRRPRPNRRGLALHVAILAAIVSIAPFVI